MPSHIDNDSLRPRRQVKVRDSEEIYEAMMTPFQGDETLGDAVLDLETGRVIYSPVKEGWWDEEVDEALADGTTTEEDIALAEQMFNNPATRSRYLRIPEGESWWSSQDLTGFLETVDDPKLHDRLARSIHGAGTFGRFKDVLYQAGRDWLDRWYGYQAEVHEARVKEWLQSENIELLLDPDRKKSLRS